MKILVIGFGRKRSRLLLEDKQPPEKTYLRPGNAGIRAN